jgi:hypothetical protein
MITFLKELFYSISIALVIFTLLEIIHPGIVLAYLNLNLLLLTWLILGIFIVIWDRKN